MRVGGSVVMPLLASLVLSALALSACAASSTSGTSKSSLATSQGAAGLPDNFAGAWFVTAVFPTGRSQGNAGDRHIGAAVLVKGDQVSDINGHRCFTPDFVTSHVTAEIAGLKMTGPGDIDRVEVDCAGKPFATLLQIPGESLPDAAQRIGVGQDSAASGSARLGSAMLDGSMPVLIAQRPEALYLLERAEQVLYRQASVTPDLLPRASATIPSKIAKATAKTQPVASASSHKSAPPTSKISVSKAPATKTLTAKTPATPIPATPQTPKVLASKTPPGKATSTKAEPTPVSKSVGKPQPLSPISPTKMTALVASDVSGAAPAKQTRKPDKATAKAVMPAPAAKATTSLPKAGAAIHLASYEGIGAATHGWQALRGQYPELTPLKPLYVSTEVAGKEPVIRLFAAGAAPDKLRQICSDLQSKQAYCTLTP